MELRSSREVADATRAVARADRQFKQTDVARRVFHVLIHAWNRRRVDWPRRREQLEEQQCADCRDDDPSFGRISTSERDQRRRKQNRDAEHEHHTES